ncbi:hypothetical protein PR202_ga04592 [Eleusine coracana subsp. coracana]|uniref:Uncharacterized protein n=1 Tax=Eleusine coracana subsp. coracana TaxID=191504 RepID=A0AAV5BS53_ELECO|nr:hypothetical protein PR202_ga04592 [Eleusine coracana subsp. coracana]
MSSRRSQPPSVMDVWADADLEREAMNNYNLVSSRRHKQALGRARARAGGRRSRAPARGATEGCRGERLRRGSRALVRRPAEQPRWVATVWRGSRASWAEQGSGGQAGRQRASRAAASNVGKSEAG